VKDYAFVWCIVSGRPSKGCGFCHFNQKNKELKMSTKQYEVKVYPEHGQPFKAIVVGVSAGEAARNARAQFPDAKSITAPQEL
jgi:hypothetical protein